MEIYESKIELIHYFAFRFLHCWSFLLERLITAHPRKGAWSSVEAGLNFVLLIDTARLFLLTTRICLYLSADPGAPWANQTQKVSFFHSTASFIFSVLTGSGLAAITTFWPHLRAAAFTMEALNSQVLDMSELPTTSQRSTSRNIFFTAAKTLTLKKSF